MRTPFCGKPGCEWPSLQLDLVKYWVVVFKWLDDNKDGYGVMEILAKCKNAEEAYNAQLNFPSSFVIKEARLSKEYKEV
jgi:hypothetical protein